jgi:hypothetical protein
VRITAVIRRRDCCNVKLKLIYDRQSVGQSVLVSGTDLGPVTNFFSLLEIFFRQLRICYFVAPSLTRGRVCNLLYNCFWALPEQSILGQVPQNSRPYFTVSSETVSPFVASYDSQGLRWRYSNPPPHGVCNVRIVRECTAVIGREIVAM